MKTKIKHLTLSRNTYRHTKVICSKNTLIAIDRFSVRNPVCAGIIDQNVQLLFLCKTINITANQSKLLMKVQRCRLTPSTPAVSNCHCSKGAVPYWSNPPFLIFDIRALWRSVLSATAPECQKLKMMG